MQKFQSSERLCMAPSCHIGFWGRQESPANTPLLFLCLCPHYSFLLECCSLVHFYPSSKQATTHSSVLLLYGSQKSSCLPLTFKTACVIQMVLECTVLLCTFFYGFVLSMKEGEILQDGHHYFAPTPIGNPMK